MKGVRANRTGYTGPCFRIQRMLILKTLVFMSSDTHAKPEDISAPEDNIKPLDYQEQFQVTNNSVQCVWSLIGILKGRHVSSKFIE